MILTKTLFRHTNNVQIFVLKFIDVMLAHSRNRTQIPKISQAIIEET